MVGKGRGMGQRQIEDALNSNQLIRDALSDGMPRNEKEILQITGISRPTFNKRVKELIEEGQVKIIQGDIVSNNLGEKLFVLRNISDEYEKKYDKLSKLNPIRVRGIYASNYLLLCDQKLKITNPVTRDRVEYCLDIIDECFTQIESELADEYDSKRKIISPEARMYIRVRKIHERIYDRLNTRLENYGMAENEAEEIKQIRSIDIECISGEHLNYVDLLTDYIASGCHNDKIGHKLLIVMSRIQRKPIIALERGLLNIIYKKLAGSVEGFTDQEKSGYPTSKELRDRGIVMYRRDGKEPDLNLTLILYSDKLNYLYRNQLR